MRRSSFAACAAVSLGASSLCVADLPSDAESARDYTVVRGIGVDEAFLADAAVASPDTGPIDIAGETDSEPLLADMIVGPIPGDAFDTGREQAFALSSDAAFRPVGVGVLMTPESERFEWLIDPALEADIFRASEPSFTATFANVVVTD